MEGLIDANLVRRGAAGGAGILRREVVQLALESVDLILAKKVARGAARE